MKVRKSTRIENFYYVLGNDFTSLEGVFAKFSDAGNVKLGIFITDTHLYPEQMLDVLYVKENLVWMPLFFNGRLV